VAKVSLSNLLHVGEHHGGELLWGEHGLLVLVGHLDNWLVALTLDDGEREVLDVLEDTRVGVTLTDDTLDLEDGVGRVAGSLVLGGVTDETLSGGEGDGGWGDAVTMLVGNDLSAAVLPDTDTGVGGSKIDTDNWGGVLWLVGGWCLGLRGLSLLLGLRGVEAANWLLLGTGEVLGLVEVGLVEVTVLWVETDSVLEGIDGKVTVLALEVGTSKTGVTLWPLWLHADAVLGVSDGRLVLLEVQPTGGAVGVENMVA